MADTDTSQPVALIGGVTGGIGSALARRLSAQSWKVIGYARSDEELQALAGEIDGLDTKVVDVAQEDAIAEVVSYVKDTYGSIDGYAHCIGSIIIQPLNQVKTKTWEDCLLLNLTSAFHALQALVPIMTKARRGSIAFVSTVAARRGIANHEAIAAAKAGLEGMMRSTAAGVANRGVRLNAVAPALVETPLAQPYIQSDQGRDIVKKMNPMGEIIDPEGVASLLAWLLSPESGQVTGETYGIDAGLATLTQRPKV